jgi:general stress protein 26
MKEQLTLDHVAEAMQGIDIAILSTHAPNGQIASRPMSNNGDVKYDGTSYFFSNESAGCVSDIQRDSSVALGYSSEGFFGASVYVAVEGTAKIIRDKGSFKSHWNPDVEAWFEDGIETPGLVLLEVKASRIKVWERDNEQELVL